MSPTPRRRWAGRLALAVAVAAVTALVAITLDGNGSSRLATAVGTAPSSPPTTTSKRISPVVAMTTVPPTTVQATAARTPTTTTATRGQRGPWFLPDGSVLPALLVYDGPTVTVAGALPSAAAVKRLLVLARAYSLDPHARIVNHVVVDPTVPTSVGLRVIEMDAGRFASASAVVTRQYAPELDRAIEAMTAMPRITLLVVGHADQTGGAVQNVQLSEARAEAVVNYLITRGVSPGRLSAQGVGDNDPLTIQSNRAGLALNRRTEFVFYGLFTGVG